MADMTITGDAKFGSVITEMKRVEKASDSLKKKFAGIGHTGPTTSAKGGKGGYRAPGMGILELSRGIEDAQYGLRGVLNNIPGTIMAFGGGAGLAGVVSLAAVGVAVLGKRLYDLATNAKENKVRMEALAAANQKYTSSLNAAASKLESFREKQRKAAAETKNAARTEEIFRRFGDPVGVAGRQSGRREEERAALQSIISLREKLASIGGGAKPDKMDLVGDAVEDANSAKTLIDNLIKQRAQVEREMEKANIAGMGDFGAMVHDIEAAIAFAQKEAERHKANMEADKGRSLYAGASRTLMKMEERRVEALKLEMEAITAKESFRNKDLAALSEKIKAIDLEIAAAKDSEESAKRRISYVKQEAELRKKIEERSAINDERKRFGGAILDAINKQAGLIAKFADIDSVLGRMNLSGNNMLSSSGRIGGSVKEYNSAIATINYQRDTLSELRKIARNTARRQPATYN
jgi:hypothetical protein